MVGLGGVTCLVYVGHMHTMGNPDVYRGFLSTSTNPFDGSWCYETCISANMPRVACNGAVSSTWPLCLASGVLPVGTKHIAA